MSRHPGPRRTAAGLLTLAVAVLVTTTGCANIPSSSRPQVIAESVPASAPPDDDDLRYDEIVPRAGEAPEDIVRDFLRAGGSFERSHARARAYLTDAANSNWKDATGATILEDAPYLNTGKDGTTVTMTSQQRGRLTEDGSYVPGTAPYPYVFRLKKVSGNWRIFNPPTGLLIEAGTFEAAYSSYQVYFLDSTRNRVVPDVRWYAAAPESVPTQLVAALEQGPSEDLVDSVVSDFDGVSLQNNIELGGDRVKVFLTGLGDRVTLSTGGFAQLVWTLHQVGVGGVEVYSDGRLLAPKSEPGRTLQQFGDWRSFNPDGLTATATSYFIQDGAVWTTQGTPIPGPAGRSTFRAQSVAVSLDQRSLAVVRPAAGSRRVLYVGPPGALRPTTVTGSALTRPTWGLGTREVWTVRDGRDVLIVPLTGQAVRVDVQGLDAAGYIRALSLSRDGTRVAVVAGAAGQEKLWIGMVSQQGGTTRLDDFRVHDISDSPVSDVSWSDALSVVALTRPGADSSLYSVDISGVSAARLVSTSPPLPGPPTAIAAAPSLPLLTIAAGQLWRAVSPDDPWTRVAGTRAGASAPVYPG
jgi:hypothetical protein